MLVNFHTIIYSAHRIDIEELSTIENQLNLLYGNEFIEKSEKDPSCIQEVIRENINLVIPDEGLKIERLMELAKELNVQYYPSEKSMMVILNYQ